MPSESPQQGAYTSYNENETATAVPELMAPVMDRVTPFLPYRGAMFHGVAPTSTPTVSDGEELPDGTINTECYVPPTEDLNPVPVRIVDTAIHEYRQWRAWQVPVTATAVSMVANRKEGRSHLRVKNCATSGTNRVWIGPDANLSVYTGYPLDPSNEATFTGEAAVYALADTGVTGSVTVAMFDEFGTAQ
jgi:hypothetical protein